MVAPHPFLDWPGPIPFAHRGGGALRPENTLAAFAHAVELGYRYLETDVRVTADGVVVVFHDDTLDRMTGRPGTISRLRWREVRTARVAGTEEIPTLEALLDAFPEARLNIDVKDAAVLRPLVETLARLDAFDRVCLGAFSDRRLRAVRRLAGEAVCTSAGPGAVAAHRLRSLGLPAPRSAAHCLQVPVAQARVTITDRRFVATADRRAVPVHVWTVDDPAEMERLLDLGVHGLMTDRPDLLRDVLVRRGQWVS